LTPGFPSPRLPTRMVAGQLLHRLAILLALWPQILILGLGQGVFLCVTPEGHVQMEVASSACRADCSSAMVGGGELEVSQDEPKNGSCSDLEIVLGIRISRSMDDGIPEPPLSTIALPVELPTVQMADGGSRPQRRHLERAHQPPYLVHLRSVVLRC